MNDEAPAEIYVAPFEVTTKALKNLIRRDALNSENGGDQIDIRLEVPDADFIASLPEFPVVNLYLHGFAENTTHRQSEPFEVRSRTEKKATIVRRPKYIDLFYMISVWSRSMEDRALVEQYLLSRLVQALGRHEVMPIELMEAENYHYGITMLQMLSESRQSQSEFWGALGSAPRPALNIQLTVPVPVHDPEDKPIILDVHRKIRDYEEFETDDTSPTPDPKALAGQVTLAGADYQSFRVQAVSTTTMQVQERYLNSAGLYAFNSLDEGEYMVRLINNMTNLGIQSSTVNIEKNNNGLFVTRNVNFTLA